MISLPEPAEKPVILWFRKDLRLDDNHALNAACGSGRPIVPLFIREPASAGTGALGRAQAWWLHHSLGSLNDSINAHGGSLHLASGDGLDVLRGLIETTGANLVLWNRRYDPPGIAADDRIERELKMQGIATKSFYGQLLHEPSQLLTGGGTPFRVYTPFWRALERSGEPPRPVDQPATMIFAPASGTSEPLASWNLVPAKPDWANGFKEVWSSGENEARRRLGDFIDDALDGYKGNRDFPAKRATSMLSPYLALGVISPARIWEQTRGLSIRSEDVIHFRKELAWREFSYHLLYHFPSLPYANWNSRFDGFGWSNNATHYRDWTRGMTGYPIVDAGMRQLWRHGFMHNRVRMVVASFLIKHLMIDWRRGESWFRDTLIDADPASNAASWQWVAGSGADAAPFFRIFNPVLQGEKFDPDGSYVREFVPELGALDSTHIHRPFQAPASVLERAGIRLGVTYPKPIVDHAVARDQALKAYGAARDTAA
jgi:deoxyribodipyrimidine photo-lyase